MKKNTAIKIVIAIIILMNVVTIGLLIYTIRTDNDTADDISAQKQTEEAGAAEKTDELTTDQAESEKTDALASDSEESGETTGESVDREPLIAVVDYDTRDAQRVINRIKQGGYTAERVGTLEELDMDKYDAIVIPGGNSVTPSMYGAERDPTTTDTDIEKDKFQFEAVRRYVEAGKPVLGICRGEQLVNNVLGGTTIQDMPTGWHKKDRTVRIAEGTLLYDLLGKEAVTYHYHHQAVDKLGEGLYATEWDAETGFIEAYEHKTLPVYGIQWHPDSMDETGAKVFAEFCKVVEQNMKENRS